MFNLLPKASNQDLEFHRTRSITTMLLTLLSNLQDKIEFYFLINHVKIRRLIHSPSGHT